MVHQSRLKPVYASILQEVQRALAFTQPGLGITELADAIVVEGEYIVSDGPHEQGPLARYQIIIFFPKVYPTEEPLVFETAGAIKRVADQHMYSNGRCCTCVWEEWLATSTDLSVNAFCNGPLHNFFLSQVVHDETGEWPFGERSHGVDGIVEAVSNTFGIALDRKTAGAYLQAVAARELKGHWTCPCGSGKRLRDCHRPLVKELRVRVKQEHARRLLGRLIAENRQERCSLKKKRRPCGVLN